MATPIFLLSLPRSGSTLLQRMLANHPAIATAPEPWAMLPMVYGHTTPAAPAEYDESIAGPAVGAFLAAIGFTHESLHANAPLASRVRRVYTAASGGRPFFLDKTPRYALIAGPLARDVPQAPLIVLWRDPLAVYASIRTTWPYERYGIARHEIDLYAGLAGLCRIVQEQASRVLLVRFESLVSEADPTMRRVCDHLDLPFDPAVLTPAGGAADPTAGSPLGDPTGRSRYRLPEPTRAAADLSGALCNPTRTAWCRRWLAWIGDDRLRAMGDDPEALRARLEALAPGGRRLWSDLRRERRARVWRARRVAAVGRSPLQAAEAIARGDWPSRPPPPAAPPPVSGSRACGPSAFVGQH